MNDLLSNMTLFHRALSFEKNIPLNAEREFL